MSTLDFRPGRRVEIVDTGYMNPALQGQRGTIRGSRPHGSARLVTLELDSGATITITSSRLRLVEDKEAP